MAKQTAPSSAVRIGPKAVRTSSPSLSELSLEPGTVLFGQWKIRRERRRGGHGVVFEAEEILLRETQAVKILDPVLMARSDMLERFRGEVSLMRGFSHPHILRVFDYREDTEAQLALISMEYVEGGTVRDLLDVARQRQSQVPLVLSLRILFQALDALAEAHAKTIVHRDISPANILLAGGSSQDLLRDPLRDPGVKLLDFGIAGLVDKIRRSQEGEGLGTASYAAPEVFHPEEKVTPATDIYSLGAVVWELTTGHTPTVSSPRPSEMQDGASTELDVFLLSLMDTTATRRPSSESARARAAELLEQMNGSAGFLKSIDRVERPNSLPSARRPAIRWVLGLAAALALAMGWMNRPTAGTSREPTGEVEVATHAFDAGQKSSSDDNPDAGGLPRGVNALADEPPAGEPPAGEATGGEPPEVRPVGAQPSADGTEVRPFGVYLKVERVAGTRLTADLLEVVAGQGENLDEDRPLDFENHLLGACLNRTVSRGERLEWADFDLCS